jgi:hypothetical protein
MKINTIKKRIKDKLDNNQTVMIEVQPYNGPLDFVKVLKLNEKTIVTEQYVTLKKIKRYKYTDIVSFEGKRIKVEK